MTRTMNSARNALRPAAVLLLATVAFPSTAFAQETVTPPVILAPTTPAPAPAPAPAPVQAPAPAAQTAPGESRTTIAPGVIEQAEQEARERAAARRAERPAPAARSAPARQAAPVAAAAPAAAAPAAPVAEAPAPAPATPSVQSEPVAAAPAETTTTTATTTSEQPAETGGSLWLILAGLGVAVAAIAAFLLLRRRRTDEVDDEYVEPAPVHAEPEPVAAAPVVEPRPVVTPAPVAAMAAAPIAAHASADPAPRHEPEVHDALENATLTRPDADDIDAVLGGAAPQGDRPQLELAMRPIRAGVNRDEGVVEFELTIANAGGVEAQDVRVAAFMLSDRPGQGDAIERLLIDPPADHVVDADSIAPGGGARIDAAVTLPRDDLHVASDEAGHAGFTPVVLADARYRLPDGSEGRTAAAFTIGRVDGGDVLMPIAVEDEPAMYADIEARLHSVPAKV